MHLVHLSLTNFRNYSRLELDVADGITLLQGANVQGKTNFLEAIAYLATARSLLSTAERELVNWLAWEQEPLPFARLAGDLVAGRQRRKIEIALVQAHNSESDNRRLRKEVRINGVTCRAIDLVGQMPAVLFLPQDIDLVAGAPSVRRRYLDIALCQMQPDYCRTLGAYNKALQQRNALLKTLRERGGDREQLAFWSDRLVTLGSLIVARRAAFLIDLEFEGSLRHKTLTDGRERLHVRYAPNLTLTGAPTARRAQRNQDLLWLEEPPAAYQAMDPAAIAEKFRAELRRVRAREIAAGMSLLGPHRDDVQFVVDGRDLRVYGSRGQQRTAALAVKLAEVAVMQQALGAPPLLLLDDVMSELDSKRRSLLLEALEGVNQALVTTTDWSDFSAEFRRQARCLQVVAGRIEEAGQAAQDRSEAMG